MMPLEHPNRRLPNADAYAAFIQITASPHSYWTRQQGECSMTNVDVLFRYEQQPSEAAMFALGNLKEVYGIRRIEIDQPGKTIRVEYDATRLTGAVVANLLRRGGISILEPVALVAPQTPVEHPDTSQPPAAVK